jgi:hypothetical protein
MKCVLTVVDLQRGGKEKAEEDMKNKRRCSV